MMPLQRVRVAESRMRNKLANGPLRVQSNGISQSILQRVGIRQLPGYVGILQSARVAP